MIRKLKKAMGFMAIMAMFAFIVPLANAAGPSFIPLKVEIEGKLVHITFGVQNIQSNAVVNGFIAQKNTEYAVYKTGTLTLQPGETKTITWDSSNATATSYYFRIYGETVDNINIPFTLVTFNLPTQTPPPGFTRPLIDPQGKIINITFGTEYNSYDTTVNAFIAPKDSTTPVYTWGTFTLKSGTTKTLSWDSSKATQTDYYFRVDGYNTNRVNLVHASTEFKLGENPIGQTSCPAFSDVSVELCPAFTFAKEAGIFLGDDNAKTVRPNDVIGRAEAAAVILRGFKMNILPSNGGNEGFFDANPDEWYMTSGTIRSAKEYGILKGYPNGTLQPGGQVLKSELVTMFVRASKKDVPSVTESPYLDTPLSANWYVGSVALAKSLGWIPATPNFYPGQGMTRAGAATLFFDAHKAGLL